MWLKGTRPRNQSRHSSHIIWISTTHDKPCFIQTLSVLFQDSETFHDRYYSLWHKLSWFQCCSGWYRVNLTRLYFSTDVLIYLYEWLNKLITRQATEKPKIQKRKKSDTLFMKSCIYCNAELRHGCDFLFYLEVLPSCVECCFTVPPFVWFPTIFLCLPVSCLSISPCVYSVCAPCCL